METGTRCEILPSGVLAPTPEKFQSKWRYGFMGSGLFMVFPFQRWFGTTIIRPLWLTQPWQRAVALLTVATGLFVFSLIMGGASLWAADGNGGFKSLPHSFRDDHHPVVLVFHAPWCGTCQKMAPIEKKLAKKTHPTVQWHWLNTDERTTEPLMKRFDIHVTPTYLLFNGHGKGVYRMEEVIRPSVLRDEVLKLHASETLPKGITDVSDAKYRPIASSKVKASKP